MRLGVDVVEVARIASVAERRPGFLRRVFTNDELRDAQRDGTAPDSPVAWNRLAGRFAVKEATRKALRDPRLGWRAVEVRTDEEGAPTVWIRGEATLLAVSIAHDAGLAFATVASPTT